MAKVSISIESRTQNLKTNTKSLGYINPQATNAQLGTLAIAFNNLSTKTYEGGKKTVITDLNDPDLLTQPKE